MKHLLILALLPWLGDCRVLRKLNYHEDIPQGTSDSLIQGDMNGESDELSGNAEPNGYKTLDTASSQEKPGSGEDDNADERYGEKLYSGMGDYGKKLYGGMGSYKNKWHSGIGSYGNQWHSGYGRGSYPIPHIPYPIPEPEYSYTIPEPEYFPPIPEPEYDIRHPYQISPRIVMQPRYIRNPVYGMGYPYKKYPMYGMDYPYLKDPLYGKGSLYLRGP